MSLAFKRFRHKAARTKFRVPLIWFRNRGLDANDVFLASYPRSGSTWTRFVLYEILAGEPSSFDNVNRGIPENGIQWGAKLLLPGEGRLIKTHEPYRREYGRAVYLVRDMRDVIFSQYSREKELGILYDDFDSYLTKFLQGRISGFGAWQEHLRSWLDSPLGARGDLLVLRFEELRKNMESAVNQILDFVGVEAEPEVVRLAIANNTLERMRQKETQSATLHQARNGEEGRFVRKGAVGGWREKLTDEQLRLIDTQAADTFRRMGYPLAAAVSAARTPVAAAPLVG
ncbi:MAG TPA: sulfotransferase domain-containing protein [Terriglobia bacterium]|nr:sulfotransferase domain-containing protein [Terriglobia bacterium]